MKVLTPFIIMLMLLGCSQQNNSGNEQKTDSASKKSLVVVTHNGPNTYFVDGRNHLAGLEFDLVSLFVKELGTDYKLQFLVVDNVSQVIPTLLNGKATFAASDLSITHLRQQVVQFTVPYNSAKHFIVFNNERTKKPKKIQDLIGASITVAAGTSYAEKLATEAQLNPSLYWREVKNASTDDLIEQVASGLLDYTMSNEHLLLTMQNYHPNIEGAFTVGEPYDIAWAFPKNADPQLLHKANLFFEKIKKDGRLRNLIDRYYGHVERLDTLDVTTFLKRTKSLLPQYKSMFMDAQDITGIDWRLLAAISYRESHWDRLNTSPTNVRGMMMLTEDTADLLGVTDRLDARQSILGGSRYIVQLRDQIPERIPEPDRTWMALAAYNIGFAHLEDARVLAQRMKLNPDSWADLKKTLPMLNKPEVYTTLKYGYASGGAPVIFVETIRTYYNILQRFEPAYRNDLLPIDSTEYRIAQEDQTGLIEVTPPM